MSSAPDIGLAVPAGASRAGDGIAVGGGAVIVDAYIDFICPYCKRFEDEHGAALAALVREGAITLVYHPVGFLDRFSSGTRYSTRAAAASGCAADAGRFEAFKDALFAGQPPEGGTGLSDEELVAIAREARVAAPDFAACVAAGRYAEWTAFVTSAAVACGVDGIPTVLVE